MVLVLRANPGSPLYQGARCGVPPQVLLSSPIDFCYAALPLPPSPSLKLERTKREGELMAFGDRVLYTIKDHFMIPLGLTLAAFVKSLFGFIR